MITVGALTDGLEHTVDLSTEAAMFATVTQSAHDQMLETLRPLATNCHYTRVLCDKAERIFADPHCLKQYVVDLEANVLRYLIETIWDAGAHTATLPNGKQSFVWWNRSGRDDFGVRINHREECCWTLKEFDKATPQGQYLWQPKSEFRKCQLSTHYFGISEDLRVGPERPNK